MNKTMKVILKAVSAPAGLTVLLMLCAQIGMNNSDLWAGIIFLAAIAILYFTGRIPVNEKRRPLVHAKQIVISFCIGFAYTAALILLIEALPASWKWQEAVEGPASTVMKGISLQYFLTLFLVLPIAEEISFRHLLTGDLSQHFSEAVSVLVSTLSYAFLFFLRDGLYGMVFGLVTGFLFNLIYLFTFSMWASAAAHIASNIGLLMSYISVILTRTWLIVLAAGMLAASFALLMHLEHLDEEEE